MWLTFMDQARILAFTDTPEVPILVKTVAQATPGDQELAPVIAWCLNGWPVTDPGSVFSPYFARRDALSVVNGCLLWGKRVVIS